MDEHSNRFRRWVLPGLAFKATVIGGGYATGRELVEFFLKSGPAGGIRGLITTTVVWSAVCLVTFLFAHMTRARDYYSFFVNLLGPLAFIFEVIYCGLVLLVLAVFGAAAGEIGNSVFGLPNWIGMLGLAAGFIACASFGNASVERVFKYVSILLYAVYAVFIVLSFSRYGSEILAKWAKSPPPAGWIFSGLTYASYGAVGAVIILPATRHIRNSRDAVIAGLLSGPLATAPAFLFFIAMIAFYPEILSQTLPSDYILTRLHSPAFHYTFQVMILAALLESGTGLVHGLNERIAARHPLNYMRRGLITAVVVLFSMLVATKFGLIALIARGYSLSGYLLLLIYMLPLFTIGVWKLLADKNRFALSASGQQRVS